MMSYTMRALLCGQRRHVDALHVAVDADHRRHARRQVQVRGVVLDGKGQQLRDIDGHESSFQSSSAASPDNVVADGRSGR